MRHKVYLQVGAIYNGDSCSGNAAGIDDGHNGISSRCWSLYWRLLQAAARSCKQTEQNQFVHTPVGNLREGACVRQARLATKVLFLAPSSRDLLRQMDKLG